MALGCEYFSSLHPALSVCHTCKKLSPSQEENLPSREGSAESSIPALRLWSAVTWIDVLRRADEQYSSDSTDSKPVCCVAKHAFISCSIFALFSTRNSRFSTIRHSRTKTSILNEGIEESRHFVWSWFMNKTVNSLLASFGVHQSFHAQLYCFPENFTPIESTHWM